MNLVVNGQSREILASDTVEDLLKELDITERHVAVAVNLEVISRSHYSATRLKEGDKIEIVHAVGGGSPPERQRG